MNLSPRNPLFPWNSKMPTTEILLLEESTDGGELPLSVNCNFSCFPMFPSDSLDIVSDFIKFISAFFLQGPSGYCRPPSSVEYNQWPVAPVIQSSTPTYQTSHPQSE